MPSAPEHGAGEHTGGELSKLRITVLAGGPSTERAVSLESGRSVAEALRRCGHEVRLADIGPNELGALDRPADVIFPALHGTFGEDGQVQRILEERGIPFVGSGSRASAVAMDKAATKAVAEELGVATAPSEVWDEAALAQREGPELTLPVVIKPVDQGSSVGIEIVKSADGLRPALVAAVNGYGRALVEQFVKGVELTVGIIGKEALPLICVRPRREFYDFTAKYEDDTTEYVFDTGQPAALVAQLQADSRRIFSRLGCRHLSRIDWIVDAAGEAWFLEVNTLPGFTSHSLVPKAAARIGISFEALCERLVRMAIEDVE